VNEPAGDPFEALGDATRREIVEILRSGGRSVGEIADALPISRPAVSRHLRLLKAAGLVAEQPQGTRRIYRLDDHGIAAVQTYIAQVWGDAVTRFRLMAENTVAIRAENIDATRTAPARISTRRSTTRGSRTRSGPT
jgi:DNA-binding transcriptional ArsR family regulator